MGRLSLGTTGISYQVDTVKMKVGGTPRCPRCQDHVYFNEQKVAVGKTWHIRCFTCAQCKKKLDSTNCNEHEEELFCTPCHKRRFGPKGYGFAAGAAGLSTENGCASRSSPYTTDSASSDEDSLPRRKNTVHNQITRQMAPVRVHVPKDPVDICPRCSKCVYFAEKVDALKKRWHKLCFKCGECSKMLEPGKCSEHKGDLFCTACYGKKFGPRGYGFGGGVGQLLSSDAATNGVYSASTSTNTKRPVFSSRIKEYRERTTITPGTKEWTEAVYI